MKAIRVIDGQPQLVETPLDDQEGVRVKIHSSSICGSDLHLIEMGYAEGRVLGHEFAGTTPDGSAVAVEPQLSCGQCPNCQRGYLSYCDQGAQILGVMLDGGMAEYVTVPEQNLMPLPSGLETTTASLVEPLAVAVNGINRADLLGGEQILVIGAGPIGLAACAVLHARGFGAAVSARHLHQQTAADRLGMSLTVADGYDVVIDAIGSQDSLNQGLALLRPGGRLVMLGTPWQPLSLESGLCVKEVAIVPASQYRCGPNGSGDFADAARILLDNPVIANLMLTHRFPLDGAVEAFATASDRSGGAVKVVFDTTL